MAQTDEIVSQASSELLALLQAVPSIADKTIEVYDNDQFMVTGNQLNLPLIGIVYAGLRPREAQRGMLAEVNFSLLLIGGEKCRSATSAVDGRSANLQLLDQMRDAIMLARGPGSRHWKFAGESPVADLHPEAMGYVQRWSTVIPLTKTN